MLFLKQVPKFEDILRLAERYPTLDPSAIETYLSLRVVTGELETALETHFSRYGLSPGRFGVLVTLMLHCDSPRTCSELAERLNVTKGTITGLLDGLERDGFLRRETSPDDRRTILISLTAAGRGVMEQALPDHFKRISNLAHELSDEERQLLIRLLGKLRGGISSLKADAVKESLRANSLAPNS